jgi:C_GCAxxG_C_C family probable redox protein
MKNKSKLINSANEMMENRQGNCAQAIFATYGPHLAKEKLEFEYCMKITSAFGGGVNLTGNVCGAITGALMSLGLKFNRNFQDVTNISSQFIEEFKRINGSIICRELIGYDISEGEDFKQADQKEIFKKCKKYVIDAACLLENYINDQSIKEGN